jgi:hypothetical protein
VADGEWGNRILIWNSIPTSDGAPADLVLGQPDFVSNASNNGGISGARMSDPIGITVNNGKFYAADHYNNRILVWNSLPTVSSLVADSVFGQADFVSILSNPQGASPTSLNYPSEILSYGSSLLISDSLNDRILIIAAP